MQYTTYREDFYRDVSNLLGAWSEGKPCGDYGTNTFGLLASEER
jgi:hypothetical protein